jgi:CelD/BcsL family acetyltransferase involved in cellulose biosynthesis
MTRDSFTIVLGLFAVANLANGAWMLADPAHWYEHLPAAVPDFGPLNEHFVRDIGAAFTVIGIGLAVAAFMPRWRVAACGAAAAFYGLHALVHVVDTLRGLVGPEHWAIDLPGVYIPAVALAVLTGLVAKYGR